MNRSASLGLLLAGILLLGACDDDGEGSASTTTGTVEEPTSTSEPMPDPEPSYEFAVTLEPGQPRATPEADGSAPVFPGQVLPLQFTESDAGGDPCPADADIDVTDRVGQSVTAARGKAVTLPDAGIDGPIMITVRCERDGRVGIGRWGPAAVLDVLSFTVEESMVAVGTAVRIEVPTGCADGSSAVADLVDPEGLTVGDATATDGDGRAVIEVPPTISRTLFVRVQCGGDDPAIGFAQVDVTFDSTQPSIPEPPSDRIEYQPDVFLSLVEPAECGGTRRPVIVTRNPTFAAEFAERGYLGVVVDYRTPGYTGTFDAESFEAVRWATNDLAIAVQWLRANAADHCGATDAIAAMGHSIGGIISLTLAYSIGDFVEGDVVTLGAWGEVIVGSSGPPPAPAELAGLPSDIAAAVSFSGFAVPDTIEAGEPPSILHHGRNDTRVPFTLAEQTCAAAITAGVTCELVPHDSGHNMADDIDAAYDVVAEFLTREMLAPAGLTTAS